MAEDFNDIRRNISFFLVSLRRSIERPFRGKGPEAEDERERFMRTMMMVEEARIRFYTHTRYRAEPNNVEWIIVKKELLNFINLFQKSKQIDPSVYERRFAIAPLMSRDREQPTSFMQILTSDNEKMMVADAIIHFESYLQDIKVDLVPSQGALTFGDLERIVPRQQVAPIQFDIVDGRIVVANRTPRSAESDRQNIKSALEHICGSGLNLINELDGSNCDRRLLESVKELHSQLISDSNIVKIGLTNMACGVISAQFQDELPDAISGMINAYNSSISLYVAQFPDWDQFTQKAAAIDLDEDDVEEVDMAARELVVELSKSPALADPEVPKTIAFVQQFLAFPGNSAKRAAFAMIRTIENLVASIMRHSIDLFNKTAEKTVEAASTMTSRAIIGLLSLALVGASGIGSAALRAGAPWVKQAAEIVQKQIEKATD